MDEVLDALISLKLSVIKQCLLILGVQIPPYLHVWELLSLLQQASPSIRAALLGKSHTQATH